VPRTSIAVLGFRNLSGRPEMAWMSTALTEMFTVELGVGEKLHTITGETVTRTQRDLGLTDPEDLSEENLGRLRKLLGCDTVLLGSYLSLATEAGRRIRLDLRLQDTASGETLSVLTATRSEEELFELVSGLGRDLRKTLGTGPVSRTEVASTRASFPAGPKAGRFYSEGLERLRALDTLKARELLLRATEAEPNFPLAHANLAIAWSTLGYDENAVQEAAQALRLSTSLQREDRLLVEALHAETRRDWAKAVEIYESLWRFFPDNLEHGLRLAHAEVAAGRPKRALLTVAGLRRLPAPLVDDPRIDLAEAEASAALSNYAGQERAATQAAKKGRQLGARLLTAQALHYQGHALRSLGRQEEALARIQEAERIFSTAHDQVAVARAVHDIANLLRDRGDFEGAREQYERALEVHEDAGNRRGIVLALTNLGGMELQTGNYGKAQTLLQRAVGISREVHDPLGEGRGLSNLGSVLQEQGKLQEAQLSLQEALRRFRSIGNLLGEAGTRMSLSAVYLDLGKLPEARAEAASAVRLSRQINHPRSLGLALRKLGLVLIEEGRLDEAQAAFQEMEELAGKTGHKLLLADARAGMAQVHRFHGNLAEARQNAQAALALWTETDERQQAAGGRLVLARLALDEGKTEEANLEAREAVTGFSTLHLADGEALAREALTQIFLARGQPGAASLEIRKATELVASSENRRARLTIEITAGRTAGAQGRTAEARRTLVAAHAESATLGFQLTELDAALALAELDLLQGNPAGQRALESLHEEAARQGFHLVASRARSLLRGADVALTNPRKS
jgi:tetratricopeptide (TPR) repeat protein